MVIWNHLETRNPIMIFTFLIIVIPLTNAVSLEKDLRSKVLDKYDRWTRPVNDYNDVVNVTYEASIYQIADFDAKAETLSTLIWPVACWNDAFVNWNPEENNGIEVIRVSQEEIWTPDIVPYNDVGRWDTKKYKDNIPAMAHYNGKVCWQIPIIMETICSMDVTDFPFDEQVCQISLGSWQYSYKEVRTLCSHRNLDKSTFTPNSQWQLEQYTCEEREEIYYDGRGYSYVLVTVGLKRLGKFYVLNLILPTGILLALSSLVFFLPSELTDRICYGITVTLALCVNLVIVIDFIPETSRTIPSLCTYFLVSICLSGFSILLSAVSLNVTSCDATSYDSHAPCMQKSATNDIDLEVQNYDVRNAREITSNGEQKLRFSDYRACGTIRNSVNTLGRIVGVVYFLITTLYTLSFLWNWSAPTI